MFDMQSLQCFKLTNKLSNLGLTVNKLFAGLTPQLKKNLSFDLVLKLSVI